MNTIQSAPLDRVVLVSHPQYGEYAMQWNNRRRQWEGIDFTLMGRRSIYWDSSVVPPTHWRDLPA